MYARAGDYPLPLWGNVTFCDKKYLKLISIYAIKV